MWKSQPCPATAPRLASTPSRNGGTVFHRWRGTCEAHISAPQPQAHQQARVPHAHGDAVGARGTLASAQEGSEEADRPHRIETPRRLTAQRLGRSFRITRAAELRAIMTQGKRHRTDHLDLFTRPSPVGFSRLAVVVAKGDQSAVRRNQLRRRLREIGRREVLPVLAEATDVVARTRRAAYEASFETLRREFVGSLCPSSHGSSS
jgi:ribonuclease P protein component